MPRPLRHLLRIALVSTAFLLAAGAAEAQFFTVTLENGTSFDTRYRPLDVEWSDDLAMMMTDSGNWIVLDKSEIVDVTSDLESSGFGYRVNTTTVLIGWTPNDYMDEEEGEGGEGDEGRGGGDRGATQAPLNTTPARDFSLNEFADPIGGGIIPNGPTYGAPPETSGFGGGDG